MAQSLRLLSGVTLPYVEQGNPSGAPVLLLHGFAGSWRSFERVLRYLPPSIHAIALTQRGHGEATKPPEGYTVAQLAEDVVKVLDALGWARAVLVGHSMGSAVAQVFAVEHGERLSGLVLVGACVVEPGGAEVRRFWDATVSTLEDPISERFVRAFLRSTVVRPMPQEWFDTTVQEALKVPAHVWKATWRGRLELEDISPRLGEIAAPTLVVWGDQDERCPRRHQDALVEGIAEAQLVVYPGAGHSPHDEEPERFAADLAAFAHRVMRR